MVEGGGFEPPKLARQIYSLIPLATREPLQKEALDSAFAAKRSQTKFSVKKPAFTNNFVNSVYSCFLCSGAATKSRTRDLLITNQLLYQLSYTGKKKHYIQINRLGKNNLFHQDRNSHLDFLQDIADGILRQENT